jgi:hypothetical protein
MPLQAMIKDTTELVLQTMCQPSYIAHAACVQSMHSANLVLCQGWQQLCTKADCQTKGCASSATVAEAMTAVSPVRIPSRLGCS